MSIVTGIFVIYNYFTNSSKSFVVRTGIGSRQFVTVQPEAGDTIETLTQRIQDRVRDSGGTWTKCWMPPSNPSELEKAFDEAIEWTVAFTKFEMARAYMLRRTLSEQYGKDHNHRLFGFMSQAIHGDANDKSKPWLGAGVSLWQSHKKLAGMSREDAMEHMVQEVARQKALFSDETIVPNHVNRKHY